MRLSRLYCNRPELFEPIRFVPDLNVVLAEIRVPENRKRDTHNLGKSTLGGLLDFGFLASRDPKFFLFKHLDLFATFVFFLEIELLDGTFVTVRRSVAEASKIAFKIHDKPITDLLAVPDHKWDHFNVPFDRARALLDSLLNWNALKPWQYRKGLGYFLRSQEDYQDVFQLRRFAGGHADWKPLLAQLLGFEADLLVRHYAKESELEKLESKAATIRQELGGEVDDASKIDGILLLKRQDVDKKQQLLDAFDFRSEDKEQTKLIVEQVDERIAQLNQRRYSLSQNRKKITLSLEEERILFDPEEAALLFREAGVLFDGQIKRDFDQLLQFNAAITNERRGYLEEDLAETEAELKTLGAELNTLGRRRSETLAYLSSTDSFEKYKLLSGEMVTLRADIVSLERRREFIDRLQQLRTEIRALDEEKIHLQTRIEANVETMNSSANGLFTNIRLYFNEIIEEVIGRKALLSVSVNKLGHLEFRTELLDGAGNSTSADRGHSYKKLLCIAFDLAVLRAHLTVSFPRFAYHDGAFESLDDRTKENLVAVLRNYNAMGIQTIITLIDSDLPPRAADDPVFDIGEIVLLLHDEGEQGLLFKMSAW